MGFGLELSGMYFYGSGLRYYVSYNADLRQMGSQRPNSLRLRPNGTMVPRNNFVGLPIHRVDMRLLRRFPLGGRTAIEGILELFNVFNRANYGAYAGIGTVQGVTGGGAGEVTPNYGAPSWSSPAAYAARRAQMGFRLTF
jgi:hypothetical protein